MKLKKLIYKSEYTSNSSCEEIEIDNITSKIEEITEKSLFVLLKSIKFDVREIIEDVILKSPAAIIKDEDIDIKTEKTPVLTVKNTRSVLPFLYSRFYSIDYSKMRFIGITGTNGKTTCATMLAHIIAYSGKRTGFIGTGKITVNNKIITEKTYSMTTPDVPFLYYALKEMQNAECEFIVMEVSSHSLYFEKTLPIPFEISIFTNLSEEHLDFHKNIEDYYKTKLRLFSKTKLGIFNVDNEYGYRAYKETKCDKISVGTSEKSDIKAIEIKNISLSSSEYVFRDKNSSFKVKLNLGGIYNISNSQLAISAALRLNISDEQIKKALINLNRIDGRLEEIKGDDINVIIDYAHTEKGLENALKAINTSKKQEQKLIVVFGCGGERDKLKRPKMATVSERNADFTIVTSDNSRNEPLSEIISDILSGFSDTKKRLVITSRKAAIEYAILNAESNSIVAVIGKGHEQYFIDNSGYHDFNEREIIKNAIEKRKGRYKCENLT